MARLVVAMSILASQIAIAPALGSVGALVDSASDVVERYVYDPYGRTEVLSASGSEPIGRSAANYQFDRNNDGQITMFDSLGLSV